MAMLDLIKSPIDLVGSTVKDTISPPPAPAPTPTPIKPLDLLPNFLTPNSTQDSINAPQTTNTLPPSPQPLEESKFNPLEMSKLPMGGFPSTGFKPDDIFSDRKGPTAPIELPLPTPEPIFQERKGLSKPIDIPLPPPEPIFQERKPPTKPLEVKNPEFEYDKYSKFFSDLADPTKTDPVKEAEFNYFMSNIGRSNTAQTNDMIMKLKQAGVDPNAPGAGTAMMMSMARSQNANISDVIGKLNVESANRIIAANKYGLENYYAKERFDAEMKRENFNQNVNELNFRANTLQSENPADYEDLFSKLNLPAGFDKANFIKNIVNENEVSRNDYLKTFMADYKSIAKDVDSLVPGLPVDVMDLNGLSSTEQQAVFSELSRMNKEILANNKDTAKAILADLQKRFPEVFDQDYSTWDPDKYNPEMANNSFNYHMGELSDLVAIAGDSDVSKAKSVDYASDFLVNDLKVDSQFDTLWSKASDEQKKQLIASAGFNVGETIDSFDEKKRILAAELVRSVEYNTDQVQMHFDNMIKYDSKLKSWVLESPENSDHLKMYIDQLLRGEGTLDENGNLVIDGSKLVPPTVSTSDIAHYFMDWPMAFDATGKFIPETEWGNNPSVYAGNNPKDENVNYSIYGKDANSWIKYQEDLDKKWETYNKSFPNGLNRMEWFIDSEGGTKTAKGSTSDNNLPDIVKTQFEKATESIDKIVAGDLKLQDIPNQEEFWSIVTSPENKSLYTKLKNNGNFVEINDDYFNSNYGMNLLMPESKVIFYKGVPTLLTGHAGDGTNKAIAGKDLIGPNAGEKRIIYITPSLTKEGSESLTSGALQGGPK